MSSCCLVLLLITLLNSIVLSTAYYGSENTTDRDALLAIKANLHDPYGALRSWNHSVHFCEWEGVTCGRLHKRVTVLDLQTRFLSGSLSPHVGNLSFLKILQLRGNDFRGTIPDEIGRLFRLRYLYLINNSFSGEIPTNISHCSGLVVLELGYNELTGKLPRELFSFSKLKGLGFTYNKLRGELPSFIGNLSSLQRLYAAVNHFEGSIPSTLGELQDLRILQLSENRFSSTVPSSIYNLSSLIHIILTTNKLVGTLPQDLGLRLPLIQGLSLCDNNFSGRIPPSLSNASQLTLACLAFNSFSGKLPNFERNKNLEAFTADFNSIGMGEVDEITSVIKSLTNCSSLYQFSVMGNNLGGVIPNSIGNLSSKLREFGLSGNSIHGVIPLGFGNLASLELLQMGNNHFEGKIPNDITKLQKLRLLYLAENKLSGPIPFSIGNMSMLSILHLNDNALEGTIPLSFGNYKNLLELRLYKNKLTGAIPKELFNAFPLSISLILSNNLLVGSIPSEIGQLKNLAQLELSKNKLYGEIPSELSSCTSLVDLHLESNFLNGSIPSNLQSLRGLQNLDLSNNNFSGPIPKFLEGITLNTLNLSFNNFMGELPSQGVFANATAIDVYGNIGLCGGIPVLRLPVCKTEKSKRRKLRHFQDVLIAIVCSIFAASMLSLFIVCWRKNKKRKRSSQSSDKESFVKVSYADLVKATNEFSSNNIIGTGSFGLVYKGIIDRDETAVAIKVLRLERYGASKSFVAECKALRNIRHRNLLKIITSCSTIDFQGNDFKALVYEYMPNGSLEKWLHSNSNSNEESLNFGQRIDIAINVAYALDYLHHQCGNPIIHCDLKPSNVLLDADMVAHVGDFGLAKFSILESTDENQSLSIGFKGTIGYAAPEYGLGNEVTTKGDIYSYGILLLELLTGKSPIDPMFHGGLNLHNYAHLALPNDVMNIVDPKLVYDDEDSLVSVVKIGVACSMESPQDRMDLNDVIDQLEDLKTALTRRELQNVPTH